VKKSFLSFLSGSGLVSLGYHAPACSVAVKSTDRITPPLAAAIETPRGSIRTMPPAIASPVIPGWKPENRTF
jgi:hypothetical protein